MVSFSPSVFFISLCVASVALVFMPGLYPTAYRSAFPAFLCGWLYFVSTVCVFLFMFSILSQRCPLLATSLSVLFCLLSMLISDSRFDLVWFRLSCDHGWIRSGSVNVRKQQQQQLITTRIDPPKGGSMVLVCMYVSMYVSMYIY